MKLQDRTALITGANRGIGRAIALAMAREGANVIVHHLDSHEEAEAVAAEVRDGGGASMVVQGDVRERDAVEAMVEAGESALGPVDICVNNAAATIRKPFTELSEDDVHHVLSVSLAGPFTVSQVCVRSMLAHRRRGSVIMVGSVHAVIPVARSLPYNAAKAGLKQMAYTMAEELLPHRIRVNVIEPGWIDTPAERAFLTESQLRQAAERLPWGRLGSAEEIAAAAVYLASEDADYVNATTLRVDGGVWLPHGGPAGA